MFVLQIEHSVPNYEGWKIAFDTDPVQRKQSGVKHYRIFRLVDEPNYLIIDLEFDNLSDAETLLQKLHILWQKVEGKVMMNPKTRILEMLENT